jgi:hypothetical protein
MKVEIRTKILKELNSGRSAVNIFDSIAMILYTKRNYNKVLDSSDNPMNPSDFQTQEYQEIRADVERIIYNLGWDKKKILSNFNQWTGLS